MKKNTQLLAKIGGGSLIALFSVVAVPDAKAALIVNVTGTPGTGFTTWTFSGSDTASTFGNFRAFPSDSLSLSDTTQMENPNSGNFIADTGISNQSFAVLSGSATITAGSNSQALGGIFLDDDGAAADDLGFRTATSTLSYLNVDTISISGTVTIGIDLNQLITGNYFSFIGSDAFGGDFHSDPLQLNISETATTTPEPSALIGLFILGGIGLFSRKKKQK
ncbi:MAG: PEP-CTERM sorting domain-containing protein [Microcystaceae cyanobacterium]